MSAKNTGSQKPLKLGENLEGTEVSINSERPSSPQGSLGHETGIRASQATAASQATVATLAEEEQFSCPTADSSDSDLGGISQLSSQLETAMRVGRYEVGELLGSGGQGSVCLAYDPLLKRNVAIKSTHQTSQNTLDRFRREAQFSARLDHENVCKIYDVITDEHRSYIVMEYVPGISLHGVLETAGGKLPPETAVPILCQIAQGLQAAHEQGIIHRDLKTENVLVTHNGCAKITDFGIARQNNDDSNTRAGVMVGTARVMSPEQTLCEPANEQSDLFSFGVLCYEILGGTSPFLAATQLDTLRRVRMSEPPLLLSLAPAIPERLASLVGQLLRKNPSERPKHASEVVAALQLAQSQILRSTAPESIHGERRHITLLSVELATDSAEHQDQDQDQDDDSEQLLWAGGAYRRAVEEAVAKVGGSVRSVYATTYLVSFGFPVPYEDAGRRAISAAIEIRSTVRDLITASGEPSQLTIRAGLHSGIAAMSRLPGAPAEIELGRLPSVSNMLRDSAGAGEILISNSATAVIGGAATYGPDIQVGFGKQSQTARVVLRLSRTSELLDCGPETEFVGRQAELELILSKTIRAFDGSGQVVILSGEPGIGKSRLIRAVHEQELPTPIRWLAVAANRDEQQAPLHLALALLRQLLGIDPADDASIQVHSCISLLKELELPLDDYVGFLCAALSLQPPDEFKPSVWITPEKQRRLILEAMVNLFSAAAEKSPLAIVVEDLHFCDASSVDFLTILINRSHTVPLALLMTTRPEGETSWCQGRNVTQLTLEPLSAVESIRLLRSSSDEDLDEPTAQAIIDRSGGNPLFLEQVLRGSSNISQLKGALQLPPSLRELLFARLHATGKSLRIAQIAAVLGREFALSILQKTRGIDKEELKMGLEKLGLHDLVQRKRGFASDAIWAFKHALIRDAAYDTLLALKRRELHADIKNALEIAQPHLKEEAPQLLAYHAQEAGLASEAAEYWKAAAIVAATRSAHQEAGDLYDRALAQVRKLKSLDERNARELELQSYKGVSALTAHGYGSPVVERCFSRAKEICEELGQYPFIVFWGIWVVYLTRGNEEVTRNHADYLKELVQTSKDPAELLVSHNCLSFFYFYRGDLPRAAEYIAQATAFFDAKNHINLAKIYGGAGGFYSHCIEGYVEAMRGQVKRGLALSTATLALAESLDHPYSLVEATSFAMVQAFDTKDCESIRRHTKVVEEGAERYGFILFTGIAMIGRGWLSVQDSPSAATEALALIEKGCSIFQASGVVVLYPQWLRWKADALQMAGQPDAALQVIDEALSLSENCLDKTHLPSLQEKKSQLLLRLHPERKEEALKLLRSAASRAKEGKQRLFELQAELCLARLGIDSELRVKEILEECDIPSELHSQLKRDIEANIPLSRRN